MVGVPKSTGCSTCRQQKKKCEVTSKPPCSRCVRLKIQCSGYGERRLKFQDESKTFALRSRNNAASASTLSKSSLPEATNNGRSQFTFPNYVSVPPTPNNALTTLTGAFAHCMNAQGPDISFHLAGNFGEFLADVPRHLGNNVSLDRVAGALVTSYSHFRQARCMTTDPSCLNKYVWALNGLRRSLRTTETANETETLCAITMLMAVEALIAVPSPGGLQHAGGAAQVFKCRGIRPPRSALERKLLFALRGPVVLQSFFLPLSHFSPTEWTALICGCCPAGPFGREEIFFQPFAKTARLFQRTRKVILDGFADQEEIDNLSLEATLLHEMLAGQGSSSQELFYVREPDTEDVGNLNDSFKFRRYGFTLMTTILVNCILAVVCGTSIEAENEQLCRKICDLAESPQSKYHRPIGTLWLQMVIYTAYVGARVDDDQRRVQMLLEEQVSDYMGKATSVKRSYLDWLAAYFKGLITNVL